MSLKNGQGEFNNTENYTPRTKEEKALVQAFLSLKDEKQISAFLRDLMTPAEITEFSNRLEIARLLLEGKSYAKIAQEIGTSTTTVTRVAHWLFNGCGGYWQVLKSK